MIVICEHCKSEVDKPKKEVNRSLKLGRLFFCNLKCSAEFNASKTRSAVIQQECPVCHTIFETTEGKYFKEHCGRSCASKGSVTDLRRSKASEMGKANFIPASLQLMSQSMKKREAWKYVELKKFLDFIEEGHEFEGVLEDGNFIYDLVLLGLKIVVEFDGAGHTGVKELDNDQAKEEFALSKGYKVERIKVESNRVIPASVIYGVLG